MATSSKLSLSGRSFVIAFEIKAGTRIGSDDLRGLRQLKDRLGRRLQEAIILYTGVHAYSRDD